MSIKKQLKLSSLFPSWCSCAKVVESTAWDYTVDWSNPKCLGFIIDIFDAEMELLWKCSPDTISRYCSNVISDISGIDKIFEKQDILQQINFFRFYVCTQLIEMFNSMGRFSQTLNWILCATSSENYKQISVGKMFDITINYLSVVEFLNSRHKCIQSESILMVAKWISALFYYDRKISSLRKMLEAELQFVIPNILRILLASQFRGFNERNFRYTISAYCQFISWSTNNNINVDQELINTLEELYNWDMTPISSKINIGITFAGAADNLTKTSPTLWAKKTYEKYGNKLQFHEKIQLLVLLYTGTTNFDDNYQEVITEIKEYVSKVHQRPLYSHSDIIYDQLRLYDIIEPLLAHLIEQSCTFEIAELLGTWFGVQTKSYRKNIFVCVPNHEKGVLYLIGGKLYTFVRHKDVLKRTVEITNKFINTHITIRGENVALYESDNNQALELSGAEFEDAIIEHCAVDKLERHKEILPDANTGLIQFTFLQHPIQALQLKHLQTTWPIVASYEEPERDRVISKVLLWTTGTKTCAEELQVVQEFFSKQGIDTDPHINVDIDDKEFKAFYQNQTYDVLWIVAHGLFDPSEPHQSFIQLSKDGSATVRLSELLNLPVPGQGRRLLFLNICSGGAAQVFGGPAKYGLAAIMCSSKQAVISNLWPIRESVACSFGHMFGEGLLKYNGNFFVAYCYAMEQLQKTFPNDIRAWGSPVFYE